MTEDLQTEQLQTLFQWIEEAQSAVFFGGAGVSTESGIPDFRSEDGLYRQKFAYPPEYLLSRACYDERPEEFFDFYRQKILPLGARPNAAHLALARWEKRGGLSAVVTQNIDGLHQAAGSERVYELHGSVHRNPCLRCGRVLSMEEIAATRDVPRCACGGAVKPDVVLYGEPLPQGVWREAVLAVSRADLLLVAGTSLAVYPANTLLHGFTGSRLVIVNREETPSDGRADLVLRARIGEVLSRIFL